MLEKENVLLDKAIGFATRAHAGQVRKGTSTPYILHPLEAAAICATVTDDPEVLAAAVLHDVVEDTDATIDKIETWFGTRVATLVANESENKRESMPASETWRIRKEEAIEHIKSVDDPAARLVCLGDKLSNMRAIHRDYDELGNELWGRFNQKDPTQHAWYYRSLAQVLEQDFGETVAWCELANHIEAVFGGVSAASYSDQEDNSRQNQDASSANDHWYCAETESELAELLEMFWEFHDFRIEQIDYSAAEDRIDLRLEYDTHDIRVLLRFVDCAYMNFESGRWYPADWLQGASLGLRSQGQIVWAADDGIDPLNLPNNVLWISGFAFSYAMLDEQGRPTAIPESIVHQEYRGYDYKLGKKVEYAKDFHPRALTANAENKPMESNSEPALDSEE